MKIPVDDRAALVEESRQLYRGLWDRDQVQESKACLFHAVTLQGLLIQRFGARTMLQAGSAQWPLIRREDDDGERATHFGYEWQGLGDDRTAFFFRAGALPELHCWLAHRDPDTIVDPTTGTWPARARRGGFPEWLAPAPPPFLWTTVEELVADYPDPPFTPTYTPDLEACRVADELAGREIYPKIMTALGLSRRRRG